MSRLIWIYAVCKNMLVLPVAVRELMKTLWIPVCFTAHQTTSEMGGGGGGGGQIPSRAYPFSEGSQTILTEWPSLFAYNLIRAITCHWYDSTFSVDSVSEQTKVPFSLCACALWFGVSLLAHASLKPVIENVSELSSRRKYLMKDFTDTLLVCLGEQEITLHFKPFAFSALHNWPADAQVNDLGPLEQILVRVKYDSFVCLLSSATGKMLHQNGIFHVLEVTSLLSLLSANGKIFFTRSVKNRWAKNRWDNALYRICAQQRLRSACAFAVLSEPSLSACTNYTALAIEKRPAKTLIRLRACAVWSESSMAHTSVGTLLMRLIQWLEKIVSFEICWFSQPVSTLSTLGKLSSRRHFEIFFIFPRNQELPFHAICYHCR